ncbi:M48 family metalloprotease [Sulfuritalea hydrogenivorans]|uniref:Protease HtpX-like protein n=1 Tax=Sulfuritalea hydrogenivorans sk43H TaxID=1223802 RepID=W0SFX0_9PROT|nr:M48 family metallopeptidase [Sulfuritalea hydrogenivorans]BAO29675.1 protease HtpX-like protein [Sulfuritalea hydrogenivorans sk43H]
MSKKSQEIAEHYAGLQTYELLERYLSGNITDEARKIALAEFQKRGVDPTDPNVLAKAQAEAELAAYERKRNTSPEEVSQQETGKLVLTVLMVAVIPIIGWLLGYFSELNLQQQFVKVVNRQFGAAGLEQLNSLRAYCEASGSSQESICARLEHISWLQNASIAALAAGILLLIAIILAARKAAVDRQLLLRVFSPLRVGMLFALFILILVQGAIASYGAYIFEATAIHRVHWYVIGAIAVGAFIGAFTMLEAGLSISKNLSTSIIGKSVSRDQQQTLWNHVEEIAKKLGATPPNNIVLGLEPNFYVTASEVKTYPGPVSQTGTTLYLSLPLMRILSVPELSAVIGHELGHFRGQDTDFSLRFYPIYAGTAQALQALNSDGDGKPQEFGLKSIGLIPATALLSFFMGQFAKAERTIGRDRELEADKAGASVASSSALATSLIKVAAYAPAWSLIRSAMVEALQEQKAYQNTSSMFHEIVVKNSKSEIFDGIGASVAVHPTDTHPSTEIRLSALGHSMEDFLIDDLRPASVLIETSVSLVHDLDQIEEELTLMEHQALVAMGVGKSAKHEEVQS